MPAGVAPWLCPRCLLSQAANEASGEAATSPASDPAGPAPRDTTAEVFPQRFGGYELLERVGHGGMGIVYRARQISLDRIVAVKVLPHGALATKEQVLRFRTEAAAAGSLQHPNIVAIHEVGLCEDRHYLVMDFVAGQTLAELARAGPSPPQRAARYVQTIAEAVHHAHEHGILHRDLKPANVLIDAADQPRVTDFGLAKRLESGTDLTLSGQVLGSPQYMPPEQAGGRHRQVGRRSDVYALGAILYHLLTGRPPFVGETLSEILPQVANDEPLRPRQLNPAVPVDLETVCLKCLEKEMPRRYPTALALAEELGRFLRGEPIVARPVGLAGKAWRWSRRKPQAATLAAMAALLFVLGLTGVLLEWRRAEMQRVRAEADEYVFAMNVAQQAIKANNPGHALELLNRYRPETKPKVELSARHAPHAIDPRGFEWRYLWEQSQSEAEAVIGKLPSRIRSLEISADGQWLFAGPQGGEPRLWNLSTGELVPVGREADWAYGAFSPDSRLLLFCAETRDSYGKILVWDLRARKWLEPILDPRPIATMAFSADGRWFAYGVHQPPWGRGLVVLDFAARRKVHDAPTLTPMEGLDRGVDWVFTRDGRSVIFSENDPDRRIGLCDLGATEARYFPGHRDPVSAMALSPNGKLLATGAAYTDNNIRLWEIPSFRPLGELTGHHGWIRALSFSPDGHTLVSASVDQTCRLWDVRTQTSNRVISGLSTDVVRLRFSPDGEKLFTGSADGTIHRWSVAAPKVLPQPIAWPRPPELTNAATAPDGTRLAALRRGGVCLGEFKTNVSHSLPDLGTNNTCLLFSADGQSLFIGTETGEVQVWSLSQQLIQRRVRGTTEPVLSLHQDPGGHMLVVEQRSADFAAGSPYPATRLGVWAIPEWRQQLSWAVAFGLDGCVSTDGRRLAVKGARGVVMRDLNAPSDTNQLAFPGEVLTVSFSPDGRLLAAGNLAGSVKVWDVRAGRKRKEFQAQSHGVSALAFTPDGRRLATAGDGSEDVKLWDVGTWQELITLPFRGNTLQELVFSADGNDLIGKSYQNELFFWRVPSFAEIEAAEKRTAAR